jgi:hypothetical protein
MKRLLCNIAITAIALSAASIGNATPGSPGSPQGGTYATTYTFNCPFGTNGAPSALNITRPGQFKVETPPCPGGTLMTFTTRLLPQ